MPDGTARYSHPCSNRDFRDIRVPNFLFSERNTKKIPIDFTGQLPERFVQFALSISGKHLLTPESTVETASFLDFACFLTIAVNVKRYGSNNYAEDFAVLSYWIAFLSAEMEI